MKSILATIAIVALLVGGLYFWMFPGALSGLFGGAKSEPEKPLIPVDTRSTYASTTLGLSLRYPQQYALDESYAYDAFGQNKLINGVKFSVPASMATGTNLSSDSYVSVEWLPRALKCTGDIYLKSATSSVSITEGGVKYLLAKQTGAAAGNIYEEWVYAIENSTPCTALRYFIHSTNIGNYATGTVQAFNKTSLIADFDQIRRSLQLGSAPAATTTSTQP